MEKKTERRVTRKKQKVLETYEIKNFIVAPNKFVNMAGNFTLYQERFMNAIMYALQKPIKQRQDGKQWVQMDLFKNIFADQAEMTIEETIKKMPFEKGGFVYIDINLSEISTPNRYPDVKKAIEQLINIPIRLPLEETGIGEFEVVRSFFAAKFPKVANYNSTITIELALPVAIALTDIKMRNGIPIHYTRFGYEVSQQVSNKYTSRIYKKISSWKKKGGFIVSMDEFREWLCIEDIYPEFRDIKKRILTPAAQELRERADCWFEYDTIRKNNTVVQIQFKVISPETIALHDHQIIQFKKLLSTHLSFAEKDFNEIKQIFEHDNFHFDTLYGKLERILMHLERKRKVIRNRKQYAIKAFLNTLPENEL